MNLYRCSICGEVYAGDEKPSHCPFCGAHKRFLVLVKDYVEKNIGTKISEKSKGFLEQTLKLEIIASRFYRGVSEKTKNVEIQGLFKYLAKIEKEHADVACKLLGISLPDEVMGTEDRFETDKENIEESLRLEKRATEIYSEFLKNVTEDRLKTVFSALIQIESDHTKIDEEELEKL